MHNQQMLTLGSRMDTNIQLSYSLYRIYVFDTEYFETVEIFEIIMYYLQTLPLGSGSIGVHLGV